MGYFWGSDEVQIVLGSTLIGQQHLFCLFLSILIFDFDLILWLFFFTFWDPNGLFLGAM